MKFLMASLLILAVCPFVAIAKRRRVPFITCPSSKSNSALMMVKPARSRIECSVICLNDPECLSASYCKTSDGYRCQLSGFYAEGSCTGLSADGDCTQTAIVNPCENGGSFINENRTCQCAEGFIGDYCHRRYRDCMETPMESTVYTIQPLGSDNIFNWYCPATNVSFTAAFQFMFTMIYSHSWDTMKHGIPHGSTFYFIGLENIHQLTRQGMYDMYVYLNPLGLGSGRVFYRNFRVDSEAEGYAWHWDYFEMDTLVYPSADQYLDGFGGVGDATKNLNGARFATYDNDVSGCATVNDAAWWYNPVGCTTLRFESNGLWWPTNRTGTIAMEYIKIVYVGFIPVYWFVHDDLVL